MIGTPLKKDMYKPIILSITLFFLFNNMDKIMAIINPIIIDTVANDKVTFKYFSIIGMIFTAYEKLNLSTLYFPRFLNIIVIGRGTNFCATA